MIVDQQTLRELEILPRDGAPGSLFARLDHTVTQGGRARLRRRLQAPLSDIRELRATQDAVAYLATHPRPGQMVLDRQAIETVEWYLASGYLAVRPGGIYPRLQSHWVRLRTPEMHRMLVTGLLALQSIFRTVSAARDSESGGSLPRILAGLLEEFHATVTSEGLQPLLERSAISTLHAPDLFALDRIVREVNIVGIRRAIDILYELDALFSLAEATRRNRWTIPVILDEESPRVAIAGLYHPFVINPVPNAIGLDATCHLGFITGPNMAGKTTFLKACAIALFLAHLGAGVPAESMQFTPFARLASSLSANDSVALGYSSFYSEMRRVREIVEPLLAGTTTFAILDEPFKTTNVIDAHDATRALINALAASRSCFGFISSHLAALAKELSATGGVALYCFEARVDGSNPVFDFKLKDGYSEQRLGMTLLSQVGLLDLFNQLIARPASPPPGAIHAGGG